MQQQPNLNHVDQPIPNPYIPVLLSFSFTTQKLFDDFIRRANHVLQDHPNLPKFAERIDKDIIILDKTISKTSDGKRLRKNIHDFCYEEKSLRQLVIDVAAKRDKQLKQLNMLMSNDDLDPEYLVTFQAKNANIIKQLEKAEVTIDKFVKLRGAILASLQTLKILYQPLPAEVTRIEPLRADEENRIPVFAFDQPAIPAVAVPFAQPFQLNPLPPNPHPVQPVPAPHHPHDHPAQVIDVVVPQQLHRRIVQAPEDQRDAPM
jgi:hypothetical protein